MSAQVKFGLSPTPDRYRTLGQARSVEGLPGSSLVPNRRPGSSGGTHGDSRRTLLADVSGMHLGDPWTVPLPSRSWVAAGGSGCSMLVSKGREQDDSAPSEGHQCPILIVPCRVSFTHGRGRTCRARLTDSGR
jgi:hypothetical protein